MPLLIEVSFHHFESSESVRNAIDERIDRLEKYADSITSGRVVVDGKQRHGTKTVVEIAVEISAPGKVIVGKRTAEFPSPAGQRTFDSATAEAFNAVETQLRDHMNKMRPHETKTLEHGSAYGRIERLNGNVKNGFIEMPEGTSLFFADEVLDGEFEKLSVGDEVMVTEAAGEGPYGPQASRVKPIAPMSHSRVG